MSRARQHFRGLGMSTIELAVQRLGLVNPPGSAAHAAEAIRKVSGFKPRMNPAPQPAHALPQRLPTPTWADPRQTPQGNALPASSIAALSAVAGAALVLAVLVLQGKLPAQGEAAARVSPRAAAVALVEGARDVAAVASAASVQRRVPAMSSVAASAVEEPATAALAVALADTGKVGEAIDAWARAWSERDVSRYFGFYASEFTPDRGVSRSVWQGQRRKRLQAPSAISVTIRDLRLEPLAADRIIARFTQDYAADNYRETGTQKMLVLVREAGGWRIAVEALQAAAPRPG